MNSARLLVLSLFCLTGTLHAHLGETMEQCEARYGPRIETRKTSLPQCDPEAAVYSKGGVTVVIEFMKGKAAHIILRKPVLQPKEVEELMKEFGSETWSQPLAYEDRQFRLSGDKSMLAFATNNGRKKQIVQLDLMLRECAAEGYAKQLGKLQKSAAK